MRLFSSGYVVMAAKHFYLVLLTWGRVLFAFFSFVRLRLVGLAKKRKRPRSSLVRAGKRRSTTGTRLLEDLERRGVLHVKLNMDEVNSDVGAILANVDSAKATNTKGTLARISWACDTTRMY